MATINGRAAWKHAPGVYRRHTLLHPAHALVLAVPVAIGAFTLDVGIALVGLAIAELFVAVHVPRLAWTRRSIEARLERRVRVAASVARADLLERMSAEHRRELLELEGVVSAIRERCGLRGMVDDGLGLERLVELYVRFAIAHRVTSAALEADERARPDVAIADLEQSLDSAGDLVRGSIERRLAILRARSDARRAAKDQRTAIGHELAAISDTLRWMHEHSASMTTDALRADLDVALAARERDAATLRELCALRLDRFDADVIPLGRDDYEGDAAEPRVRVSSSARYEAEEACCGFADPLPAVRSGRA